MTRTGCPHGWSESCPASLLLETLPAAGDAPRAEYAAVAVVRTIRVPAGSRSGSGCPRRLEGIRLVYLSSEPCRLGTHPGLGDALEEIMTNSASSASEYNAKIIEEFRANEGRLGGEWAGTTVILVHHIGARSGIERVTPLGCFVLGDGRFAI